MPAKQRRRSDEERAPACSRQQTTRGSKEHSIGRAQLGPIVLATQHGKFVAEHNDLEFLELIGAEAQYGELQQAPEHEIAERPEQRATPPRGRAGDRLYGRIPAALNDRTELMHPTGHAASFKH
jgi:hypothetical protein